MSCPTCSSGSTHEVGLGHACDNCRNVWLVRGEPVPEHVRIPHPELEKEAPQ